MLLTTLTLLATAAAPAAFVPRHRPYDVAHYRLELTVANDGAFESVAQLRLTPGAALPSLELDSYGLTITAAAIDGKDVPFAAKDLPELETGTLTLTPAAPLAANKEVLVRIAYRGAAASTNEGFFTTRSEKSPLPFFFTHFEPMSARRFFPSNDEPGDKATTEVLATVDARLKVFSNGARLSDQPAAPGPGGEKRHTVRWLMSKPHSTYLVALAIGPFASVPVKAEMPASIHVAPGNEKATAHAAEATSTALRIEAEFLGVKYPWEKFDQVAVPRFFWNGMENTSLVLAREPRLVLESPDSLLQKEFSHELIAHELAHQWFGDMVTLQWWDDTWLNEGFATYLTSVERELDGHAEASQVDRAVETLGRYFREEDGPHAHPLAVKNATSPADLFDRTSYVKGAHVLRMLEHWLGTDAFRAGLKRYLETYAFRNATSAQFFAELLQGAPDAAALAAFQDAWLNKKGYPVVTPKARWDADKKTLQLSLTQAPNHADEQGPFVFKLPVVFHRAAAPEYHVAKTLLIDKGTVEASVELPAAPEWVSWNQGGTALARIDAAALPEAEWIQGLLHDPDPVWRVIAGFTLLRPLTGGEQAQAPSTAVLDALAQALGKDPSPYVRAALLDRMQEARTDRLPQALAPAVTAIATAKPAAKAKVKDPMGDVLVRRAALQTLGRFDAPPVALLRDGLKRKDLPLDLVQGYAVGLARVGDDAAIAALQAGLTAQQARGYPYFKAAAEGFGAIESAAGFTALRGLIAQIPGNNELLKALLTVLRQNTRRDSAEAAQWVKDFVLEDAAFSEDMKALVIRVLDDARSPAAREALQGIADGSKSERLRANARQALAKNFAPPPKK